MKKINENEAPAKFGTWGSRYLFNEPDFSAGSAELIPGKEIAEHMHDDEKEFFYFIKGTPLFKACGKEYRVSEGDAFLVEAGESHALINDTNGVIKINFVKMKIK
jgi:quercetin dioxygenase-like cupin family protein